MAAIEDGDRYSKEVTTLIPKDLTDAQKEQITKKLAQHGVKTVGCFISSSYLGTGEIMSPAQVDAFIDCKDGVPNGSEVSLEKNEIYRKALRHMSMLAQSIHKLAGAPAAAAAVAHTEAEAETLKEDEVFAWWRTQVERPVQATPHRPHLLELTGCRHMWKMTRGLCR